MSASQRGSVEPQLSQTSSRSEIPARWELYRLDEDPGETHDLAQSDAPPPDLRRLHQALTGWMKGDDHNGGDHAGDDEHLWGPPFGEKDLYGGGSA